MNTIRFGARIRDEHKDFSSHRTFYSTNTPFSLAQAGVGVSDPDYYHAISSAFTLGVVPDQSVAARYENSHAFEDGTNAARNALASFTGAEQVYAGYASTTTALGPVELYLGLRVENTHASYQGHAVIRDTSGAVTGVQAVPGSQSYTDLFPSVQVRYSLGETTDARIAVTRGISRPDYSLLAPSLSGTLDPASRNNPDALSVGNPELHPQHAWNFDLLAEHFFSSVGVLSGGVFYKQIQDFILTRRFTYAGPVAEFDGYQGTRPENGLSGHLLGIETEWQQRFTFLPAAMRGLGVDVNYTHVNSSVRIDSAGRVAPLARQSPSLANAALTYDLGPVKARAVWAYQGANIASYGDGNADGLGDTYFYAHSQIDASLLYGVTDRVQLVLQGLNLNNAVFGFFQGTPAHDYAIQREYYGRTFYAGAKYTL